MMDRLSRWRYTAALVGVMVLFVGGAKLLPSDCKDCRLTPSTSSVSPRPVAGIEEGEFRASPDGIPQNIFFTSKHDILQTKSPELFYENVQKTIAAYRSAWGEGSNIKVKFLTDDDCREMITKASPELVRHFDNEKHGMYKADICRVAALYLEGGYYFDVDLEVIEPVMLRKHTCFSTVALRDPKEFFQAFLASTAKHAVLKQSLEYMLEYYNGKRKVTGWMGTEILKSAFDRVPVPNRGYVELLWEEELTPDLFPALTRRTEWGACNHIVYNRQTNRPHFWSRIVGSAHCNTFFKYFKNALGF